MSWFRLFAKSCVGRRRPRPLHLEPLEARSVPATITPTTFADDGLGSGSLRDAVLQFNADTGTDDDTIQLLPGTYSLTIVNPGGRHETAGLTGDLNLTQTSHRWIIQGAGPSTIIDASQLQDRVFQIVNPGTQVVFQDLVLQGGLAQDDGSDGALAGTTDALGGGILNNGGDVTLDNVVVQNNVARGGDVASLGVAGHNANGGGIYSAGGALTIAGATLGNNQTIGGRGGDHTESYSYNHAGDGGRAAGAGLYATGGSLDISDSMVASNRATGGRGRDGSYYFCTFAGCHHNGGAGGAALGGGLYVNGSALTISTSAIGSDQAAGGADGAYGFDGNGGGGGGLYNSGTLTVTSSNLSGNTSDSGGGIYNDSLGTLTVSRTTVSGNSAGGGGGILNFGTLTVSNSTVSGNSAVDGGAILNYSYFSSPGTLTVSNSTLSGNTASYDGGGIYNSGTLVYHSGTLTVNNSTLSGNSASATVSYGGGGGIYNLKGTLTVNNSTLSGNSATSGQSGGIFNDDYGSLEPTLTNVTLTANRASSGGGLYDSGSPLHLHNTLIAGNFRGASGTTRDDVFGVLDSDGDYNLIGDGTGMTGLSNGVNGNQVGSASSPIDPLLGPLDDNGGPTLTHALLPGSPAIDAGNDAYATDWDQRGPGFPRISGPHIDIGAFELQQGGGGSGAGGRNIGGSQGSVVAAFLPGDVLPRLAGLESFSMASTPKTATSSLAESRLARSGAEWEFLDWVAATPAQVVDRLFAVRADRMRAEEWADDLALA